MALLMVLSQLAAEDGFVLAGVAHVNHQLRGQDADEDEAFCRRLASALSLPCEVERIDVRRHAREAGTSVEQAAHVVRHTCFLRAVKHLAADTIAVAHTRDDQAETFLLRVVRGAGPRGLAGIHPRTGVVIRPFLETPRAEIHAFLKASGTAFREDGTNADVAIPRNRIRHELIPYLEARFSPGVIQVLAREAAIARDDAEWLDRAAAEAAVRLVVWKDGAAEIDVAGLIAEPPALSRRVIREVQAVVARGRFVGFEAAEAVLSVAVSNFSGPFDLPGHRVNRLGGKLVLTPYAGRSRRLRSRTGRGFSYPLEVPGSVVVPEAACAITAEPVELAAGSSAERLGPLIGRGPRVVAEASQLTPPLLVRSRRPGDAFRPLGLHGRKKLQDFFVDEKVLQALRDTVPLVVDSRGQIVWVAGHALAEDFRVTDRTTAVVILRQEPI